MSSCGNCLALSCASSISSGCMSMPYVLYPWYANIAAGMPSPHPRSMTFAGGSGISLSSRQYLIMRSTRFGSDGKNSALYGLVV